MPPSQQEMAQAMREMQQGLADPWIRGIEAADAYVALGDAQAAGRFYTNCVGMPNLNEMPDEQDESGVPDLNQIPRQ